MQSFVSELKRRNVLRVAAFYAASAWLLVQVATQVLPFFHVGEWLVRGIVVAAAAGLPFALAIAWFYEITPHGLQLESEVERSQSITRQTGRKLDRWIIVVLGLAVIVLLIDKLALHRNAVAPPTANAGSQDKSVAVLPFENLSDEKANAYFAEGMQDEILTRLAKVGELRVVSRTSTEQYGSHPGNLSQIASQLGVANILEGSVQKAGDEVHINVQLIRATTDDHLWAEVYDRKLDNVFGVEGEVAGAIAQALDARLSGKEKQALATAPTNVPEAYDAYLRGKAIEARPDAGSPPNERAIVALYEQAVKLDPGFALAWSALAMADAGMYFDTVDTSPARREAARQAVETAARLQPEAAEARVAQAHYQYHALRDYDAARSILEALRAELPNNPEVPVALALVSRRQGRWDESLAHWDEAIRIDPGNLSLQPQLSATLLAMRRYTDSMKVADRALIADPANADLLVGKMQVDQAIGDLDAAAAIVPRVRFDAGDRFVGYTLGSQYLMQRQYAKAIELYRTALATPGVWELDRAIYTLSLAEALRYAGDGNGARAGYLQAQQELDALLKAQPENHTIVGALALVHAGLGDRGEALRLAHQAMEMLPSSRDALDGPGYEQVLAQVQLQTGDVEAALAALPRLLQESPYNDYNLVLPVTPAVLRLHPQWDVLRKDPRFAKILADAEAGAKA